MSGFLMLLWAEKMIRHVIYLPYLSVCEKWMCLKKHSSEFTQVFLTCHSLTVTSDPLSWHILGLLLFVSQRWCLSLLEFNDTVQSVLRDKDTVHLHHRLLNLMTISFIDLRRKSFAECTCSSFPSSEWWNYEQKTIKSFALCSGIQFSVCLMK